MTTPGTGVRTPAPLTDEQRRIVEAPLRPMLVVAGAGSGKTHTMAARVAWVGDAARGNETVAPAEVLGLTFTRKAAAELADRLARRAQPSPPGVDPPMSSARVSTYHAFAGAMVAEFGHRLGLETDRPVVGEAAAYQIADAVVRDWRGPLDVDLAPATVAARIRLLAAECAEHAVDTGHVREGLLTALASFDDAAARGYLRTAWSRTPVAALRTRLALLPLVDAYAERKRRLGVVDFGDQVVMALSLTRDGAVVAELRRRHRVAIFDEYQDTSSAQSRLLAAVFGAGHPVTAVGDPQQSIFGWRGAGAGTLRRFLDLFAYGDVVRVPPESAYLSTSWRNDALVLDVAAAVATALRADPGLPQAPRLRPRPDAGRGTVHLAWVGSVTDEADQVAAWLAQRRRPGRTQAVLCRTRSSFAPIVARLAEAAIPTAVVGLGGLLDEPVVIDVVSVLTAAHDPDDGPALLRLLTGARWSVSPSDLDALGACARSLSVQGDRAGLAEAVAHLAVHPGHTLSAPGAAAVTDIAAVLARVRHAAVRLPLPDLVATAAAALGVVVEAAVWSPDPRRPARVLDRLIQEAAGFTAVAGDGLGGFLAWLEAARDFERGLDAVDVDPDPSAVQVLTVHAAKGLEWDDVVVVDLAEGGFPPPPRGFHWLSGDGGVPWPVRGDRDGLPAWTPQAATDAASFKSAYDGFLAAGRSHRLDEERRLAYVAITRARECLLLTGAAWVRERTTPRSASAFLAEAARVPGVVVRAWAPPDVAAPVRETAAAQWPGVVPEPVASRLTAGAGLVRAAIRDVAAGAATDGPSGSAAERSWSRLVDRLLAERHGSARSLHVNHVSASQLVALARDPATAVADMLRPIPTEPRPGALRGSSFHAWVERQLTGEALLDVDDVPGAADQDVDPDDQGDVEAMRERFRASPWAVTPVVAVEVPFDVRLPTAHGLVSVRGRIDAVMRRGDGGYDVVDWKTGAQPSGREASARAVQLATYRLAAAALYGVAVDHVTAAFWYASTGRTVRPVDLLGVTELTRLVESAYAVELGGPSPSDTGIQASAVAAASGAVRQSVRESEPGPVSVSVWADN